MSRRTFDDIMLGVIAMSIGVVIGIGAMSLANARPGDRLTCERDYTGTCAEPEPPKDPCGKTR